MNVWKWLLRGVQLWLIGVLASGLGTHPLLAATYFVDVANGDDTRSPAEARSPLTPWRSLTRALGEPALVAGDLVQLAPGVYDSSVETFPIGLVSGVAVMGAGAEQTILRADASSSFQATGSLASGTQIWDLGLENSSAGIYDGISLELDHRDISLLLDGLSMGSSLDSAVRVDHHGGNGDLTLTLNNSTIAPVGRGLQVSASSGSSLVMALTLDNNHFSGGGTGVEVDNFYMYGRVDSTYQLAGNHFDGLENGVRGYDSYTQGSTLDQLLVGNTFSNISSDAVEYSLSSISSTHVSWNIQVLGNQFSNIGGRGLDLDTWYLYGVDADIDQLISGNTFSTMGGHAVSISFTSMSDLGGAGLKTRVIDNRFGDLQARSIDLDLSTVSAGAVKSELLIAGNSISGGTGAVVLEVSSVSSNSSSVDLSWSIFNNTVSGVSGNGIELSLSGLSSNAAGQYDVLIAGNQVSQAGDQGIHLQAGNWYGSTGTQHILLAGNTITGSIGQGMSLSLASQSALNLNDVRVQDNLLNAGVTSGLQLFSGGSPQPNVLVSGNTVTGNGGYGIDLNASFLSSSSAVPFDLGGGPFGSSGLNQLVGNTGGALNQGIFSSDAVGLVFARGNDWGSTDPSTIDGLIFDDEEDPALLAVDFSSPLAVPPTVGALAQLSASLLEDVGGDGPGGGDTLRYTAVLTGTGEIGCAAATLRAPLPEGTRYLLDSAATSRGLVYGVRDGILNAGLQWLAAGETITVTWDVLVDPGGSCLPLEAQATFSCAQLGDQLTDDPAAGGSEDPTGTTLLSYSFYRDADGDGYGDPTEATSSCQADAPAGYVLRNDDCDDASATRYPGAPELCDEIDNDCDGEVDNDLGITYYLDQDRDGYGSSSNSVKACEQPPGTVTDSTDCYDTRDDVYPGATEQCDEVDNDCDTLVDEGVTATFYADLDGDGFGDPEKSTIACRAPSGYVSVAGDCNDASSSANPLADEVCDGIDNNCDDAVDENGNTLVYRDEDDDGYGDPSRFIYICESSAEGYVANSEDCDDRDAEVNPGAAEICDGEDNDCDANTDEGVQTLYFVDSDGDGYGSPDGYQLACVAPESYVSNADDCNDSNPEINPAALEVCDALDNNCDGRVDELEDCILDESPTGTPESDIEGGGCSCSTKAETSSFASSPLGLMLMVVGWLFRRRRRRARK